MKKQNKKIPKCCEGCGKEVKCKEEEAFPLCHECRTYGAKNRCDLGREGNSYEFKG